MLFSEVSAVDVGGWFMGGTAVLGGCYLCLKIYREIFPRTEQKAVTDLPVLHGELEAFKTQFAIFATKTELEHMEVNIDRLENLLEKYMAETTKRLHRLSDIVHPILIKLGWMGLLLKMIAQKAGIAVPAPEEAPAANTEET